MKKYFRIEVPALAYFDVEASNIKEAKKRIPKSFSYNILHNSVQNGHCNFEYNHEAGVIFYEPFDVARAEVVQDTSASKVRTQLEFNFDRNDHPHAIGSK